MKQWITIAILGLVIIMVLFKFNPFKHKVAYDVIDEMQHEHEFHIHELDSLMYDVKHNYMILKNKKNRVKYIEVKPTYDTSKLIIFDIADNYKYSMAHLEKRLLLYEKEHIKTGIKEIAES